MVRMVTMMHALVPWLAPWNEAGTPSMRRWLRATCVLVVIPFAALLHHRVFFPSMCMLNRIGDDYTPGVVALWLRRDPSLPWAIVLAVCAYLAGRRSEKVRLLLAPVFISSLPLSLWIWDIPFSSRYICDIAHDENILTIAGLPMSTEAVYLLSAAAYLLLLLAMIVRKRPVMQATS